MMELATYILAGGKSTRFGSDKARAPIDGSTLIQRLAAEVEPLSCDVTVVADVAEKYADLGLRTIADRRANVGPMAGLEAAMIDVADRGAAGPWLLLLSCDTVVCQPHWIERLVQHVQADVRIVAFHDGRWQPLMGLYHRDLLDDLRRSIASGQRSLCAFIDALPHVAVQVPADWPRMVQVNRREDLDTFLQSRGR